MPILRKLIDPELLPVLARAQWALAADIMRRADGGDLISRAALSKFRNAAKATEDLVELQRMTGGQEIYVVSFRENNSFVDRDLIDWAVERYVDETENGLEEEWHNALWLKAAWEDNDWKEWGR